MRPLDRARSLRDSLAGLELAAMSIPQALGYARIAGMPAVTGFYTLFGPLLAFAVFGSSRYLVVAADSATAAILAGGISGMGPVTHEKYLALAGMVALLTGGFLVVARLLKLGFLADFLSRTVLVGFLTGVGFQVGIAVLGEMLGLQVQSHRTVSVLAEIVRSLPETNIPSLGLSALVVGGIVALNRFVPRVPGPLIAVGGAIAGSFAWNFSGHGIDVIGPIAGGLPRLGLPAVSWKEFQAIVPIAGSCFVMIVAQSAATARVYAVRSHERLDQNADLIGLAAANAAAAVSGAFVVNGSPTQTAMAERSGGRSQVTHVAAAIVVSLVLLFLTGPFQYLPRCVLGAIVFTVAIHLVDLRRMHEIRKESPGEFWLAVATAVVVVLVGVEQGIVMAMIVSLLRIVHHSYRPHTAVLKQDEQDIWQLTPVVAGAVTEPGVVIYRFGAALFYANAGMFADEIRLIAESKSSALHWAIVDAGAIPHVDYTAAQVVRELQQDLASRGVALVFAHVQSDLRPDLDRHHLTEAIGANRIFDSLHVAMQAYHDLPKM
ncbi:MAG TPA: SulP family inorganic anion transporter [Bryobacteraceae bacterium]|jgi:high affinity sulfate transporter 1